MTTTTRELIVGKKLPRPDITKISNEHDKLLFTLANINVSFANAIRRTILSDIPTIVIRSETHDINQCKVEINTSKTHNEMLAQRISSVPIHTTDKQFCDKYALELDVTNTGEDGVVVVTTEDFHLRDLSSNSIISKIESQKIFPPCPHTNRYIDIVNLRPGYGAVPGERVKLTARFEWATGKDSGMFVVGNASYGYTVDIEAADAAWKKVEAQILASAVSTDANLAKQIAIQKNDFYHIDAKRLFVPDSFDFRVQTFGIYDNTRLVNVACEILRNKLRKLVVDLESGQMPRFKSSESQARGYSGVLESSVANSWDLILEEENDTIGNMISFGALKMFYEVEDDLRELTYCAFKKFHPSHSFGVIRIASRENDPLVIVRIVKRVCDELYDVIQSIVM